MKKYIWAGLIIATNTQPGICQDSVLHLPLHTDLPRIGRHNKLVLDVFYESDSAFRGGLSVHFFKYNSDYDSVEVVGASFSNIRFKTGTKKIAVDFTKTDTGVFYNRNFYEVLQRTHSVAPGNYKAFIQVSKGSRSANSVYLHAIDSVLKSTSPVRKNISQSLPSHKDRSFAGDHKLSQKKYPAAATALQNKKSKVEKQAKKHGLTPIQYQRDNKTIFDLYYGDWFAGRYELKNDEPISNELKRLDKINSSANFNSLATNDLDHPSLFSQFKQLNSDNKDEEVKGEISLTTNLSTGQEEHSTVDNNYYELRGRTMLPVGGMPIGLEGLYTSQDNNRKIKSSYFRVHYDVESMKENLSKSLQAYNGKFAETKSKSTGLEQVYGTGINNLEAQKARLQAELPQMNVAEKKAEGSEATGATDKLRNLGTDQLTNNQLEIEEKRKQIAALERKIDHYKTLIEQNRNTNYFDSTLGYAKTKDIGKADDLSYKQMSKMGANMLPDGKAKKFLTGITTMDAGMFPKTSSKYTMNGQMIKGLDFAYDFGICESGATVGKTQYVGRDGNMDQFTCYSVKTHVKASKNQKMSLLYYGYTPDRALLAGDDFFKHANVSAPSFFRPVHIMSLDYDGDISKYVTVNGEATSSIKQRDKTDVLADASQNEKMAYHVGIDGVMPVNLFPISIQGTYDKVGKAFENSTLPLSMSGTQQYKIATKTDLFKGHIMLGVDYNRLEQNNFTSKGSNTKWGFDLRLNSRRYPSLSVSYKPFTTIRSFSDTLNIPQHPMLGSVWTSKIIYQVKQHAKSMRFQLLYNKSSTVMDTANYGNILLQGSAIYTDRSLTSGIAVGYMEVQGTNITETQPNKMKFISLTSSYNISKSISLNAGQDFGIAAFGFCRYSASAGIMARFAKIPFTVRLNTRYNTYQLKENENWKRLYSGCIDITYAFKTKISGRR